MNQRTKQFIVDIVWCCLFVALAIWYHVHMITGFIAHEYLSASCFLVAAFGFSVLSYKGIRSNWIYYRSRSQQVPS